jgi:sodium/pantothenate symporter
MILFFILYLFVMAIIGYKGAKRTKTINDFAIAGQKIGPLFVALSIVATAYSVALYMGYPGWAYAWGYSSFWYFAAMGFAVPLGFFLGMKRYRFTMGRALSLPDYLGNRYNSNFLRGLTAFVTLALVAYIGSQLAGMAKLMNAYTGMGYALGLIVIVLVVTIYIFFGGTYGHIWTDAIQMLIMSVASVVVFISGFIIIGGGIGKLTSMLGAQGPEFIAATNPKSPIAYSTFVIIMSYIMACLLFVWPQIAKVTMSLEREEDIKKCFYYVILFNFLAVFIMFGGLYARALGLKVDNLDYALPTYLITYFPAPIAALIALSIVSAGMSTADTQFVVISTSVANDLYRKVFHPPEKWDDSRVEKNSMIIARLVTLLVAGGCFVVLYLFPPWSVGLLIWVGLSALIGALCGPLLLGLYWRRGTPTGAIVSCISGLVIYVIIMWFKLIKSPFVVAVTCSAVGTLLYVIVSLLTKPMPQEHLAKFFPEELNKK